MALESLVEDKHLQAAETVLESEDRALALFLVEKGPALRDYSAQQEVLTAGQALLVIGGGGIGESVQFLIITVQGMARDIEAEVLFLVLQGGLARPGLVLFRQLREALLPFGQGGFRGPEKPELAAVALGLESGAGLQGALEGLEKLLRPSGKGAGRSGENQALHHPLVYRLLTHPVEEIAQVDKWPPLGAPRDNRLGRGLAHIFHRGQAETDPLAHHGETQSALVDIRRQDPDFHPPAFLEDDRDPVGVVHFAGQGGRHELERVMHLEPGGVIGQDPVAHAVALVEPVAGELGHQVVNRLRHPPVDLTLCRAGEELFLLLLHHLFFLLAHCPAQLVRGAQGEPAHLGGDLHHLLLVHHHAVGLFQDRLEQRVMVLDPDPALLAVDEIIDHLHRPGAVERVHGDNVADRLRLELAQVLAHPRRLELEDAHSFAVGENLESFRISKLQVVQVDCLPELLLDHFQGVLDHCQGAQAQDIDLEQADFLHPGHVVLGGDFIPALGAEKRQIIGQLPWGDHHSGGVGRGVAVDSLQYPADLEQLFDPRLGLLQLGQVGTALQGLFESDMELLGDHLGDFVHLIIGHAQHPAHIADHGPGGHGAERDDLGDTLLAVLLLDVLDHLVALQVAEIDVDVRHADPLRIEEALEEQVVLERVDIGNPQAVGDQAARGRAAARPDRDAHLARLVDQVADNQEVAGETGALDNVQLVGQPLLDLRADFAVAADCALAGHFLQQLGLAVTLGQRESGQVVFPEFQLHVAALRDLHCARQRLRVVPENRVHLLGAFQVQLLGGETQPLFILQHLAGLDADQGVLGLGMLAAEVMGVIGGHQRDFQLPGDLDQPGHLLALDIQAVVHDLDKEVVLAEQVAQRGRALEGLVEAVFVDRLGDHPLGAAAQADQAPAVLFEHLQVDPRLVVEPLQVADAGELDQVAVALQVFRQQGDMVVNLAFLGLFLPAVAGGDIGLDADNRLDPLVPRRAVELERPEQVAVVGQGQGGHAETGGLGDELSGLAGPVQQAVIRVVVQVYEGFFHGAFKYRILEIFLSLNLHSWTFPMNSKHFLLRLDKC